jgi:cytochrome c-type biogenesis protein CcmH
MIWALAVLLSVAVGLALAWPLLRGRGDAPAADGRDIAVYRDQLAELARDQARGLIGPAEAAAAHAEVARRMLAAERARTEATARSKRAPAWSVAAVALVPLAALGIYALIGSPGLPARPAGDPNSPAAQAAAIRGMVDRLAARLAQSPDDVEGWRRLARSRFVLGDVEAARAAAANAAIRAPGDVEVLLELAEFHAPASPAEPLGMVFVETLRKVLDLRPDNVQALFFLGMDAYRRDDRLSARRYWEKLLEVLPADAPVAAEIRRRVESLGAVR